MIIDGGAVPIGVESTILDMTVTPPMILRPGAITKEMLEELIGEVSVDRALISSESKEPPKAPGMKYRHYAPKAQMTIIEGRRDRVKSEIERLKVLNERLGLKVGVILFEEQAFIEAAHDFFSKLRDLDNEGVDLILAGALSDKDGVGFAVMNRMFKSAGYNIARV